MILDDFKRTFIRGLIIWYHGKFYTGSAESSPNVLVVRAGWRQREVRWAQAHCFWQGLANPIICGVL